MSSRKKNKRKLDATDVESESTSRPNSRNGDKLKRSKKVKTEGDAASSSSSSSSATATSNAKKAQRADNAPMTAFWMINLPRYVFDKWGDKIGVVRDGNGVEAGRGVKTEAAAAAAAGAMVGGELLGHLEVAGASRNDLQVTLVLADELVGAGEIKRLPLKVETADPAKARLVMAASRTSGRVEGQLELTLTRPSVATNEQAHQRLLKERLDREMERKNTMDDRAVSRDEFLTRLKNMRERQANREDNDTKRQLRMKLDSDELELRLLQLFELHPFMSFKRIQEDLNQPDAYLKKKLREMCVLHGTGDHAGKYELKSQYKL